MPYSNLSSTLRDLTMELVALDMQTKSSQWLSNYKLDPYWITDVENALYRRPSPFPFKIMIHSSLNMLHAQNLLTSLSARM